LAKAHHLERKGKDKNHALTAAADLTRTYGGNPSVIFGMLRRQITSRGAREGQQGRLEEFFYRTDFTRHNVTRDADTLEAFHGYGHAVGHPGVAVFRGSCSEGYMKYDTAVQINLVMAFMSTKASEGDKQKVTRRKEMQ
jgi:hypothetical protein